MHKVVGAIHVRDATINDTAAIARIGRMIVPRTYRGLCDDAVIAGIVEQSYSTSALDGCIACCASDPNAQFLVAEAGGEVAGFLHYDCTGPEAELHRIYVDSDLQRRGVGSALLGELNSRLGPGAGYVLMVIAANHQAVSFYNRHGFVVREHVDGPTHMHERMGVEFPLDTAPAPALVLRYTEERIRK